MRKVFFICISAMFLTLANNMVAGSESKAFYQCNPVTYIKVGPVPRGYGETAVEAATDYCSSFGDSYFGVKFPDTLPEWHYCEQPRICIAVEVPCEGSKDAYHQRTGCMPIKEAGCPKYPEGNPCNVANGNKFQRQNDIDHASLPLIRYYNSQSLVNVGFGKGWRTNHHFEILPLSTSLAIIEPNGRGENWFKATDGSWLGDADSRYTIAEHPEVTTRSEIRYIVSLNQGGSQFYDPYGTLLKLTDKHGNETSYSDSGVIFTAVTDHYGNSLNFYYQGSYVTRVTDVMGNEYRYAYDYLNGNLISVTYPDATPENLADNPRRLYHYENADFPNHLTGITDENGNRYATYAYDAQGKAIATQHAQTTNAVPQERFQLDYQND